MSKAHEPVFRPAFVVPRYGPGVVGGAEELARRTAEELALRGFEVTALATCALDHHTWSNHFPPGKSVENGVTVIRFPASSRLGDPSLGRLAQAISAGEAVPRRKQEEWLSGVVSSPRLVRHLADEAGKYTHLLFLPYLFGTTYFGSRVDPGRSWIIPCLHDEAFAYLPLIGEMLQGAAGLLFNSPGERRLASRILGTADPGPVVGMGFRYEGGDPGAFRNRWPVRGDFLLYAGRREEGKNTPLLIEYFRRFSAERPGLLTMVLAGAGRVEIPPDSSHIIYDLGRVGERAKRDAFAAAFAFCQPSVNESLSIVLLESWLAGRPALVNRGCEVTREHAAASGGGLAFADYSEFAACLEMLLQNRPLADRLGAAGRRYVEEEYNWDSVLERLFLALGVKTA